MGLIIFPFLLMNIVFIIWAILIIGKSVYNKEITISHFITGIAITTIIYGTLFIDYKLSDKAYALDTYFMFPFFMVSVPFFTGLCSGFLPGRKAHLLSKACLISTIMSGVFIAAFQTYTFNIIDFLGIAKYY